MRFSQAYSPTRALDAAWRMLKAAPGPMLLGGLLMVFTSGGGGGGGGWNPSDLGSIDREQMLIILGVVLFFMIVGIAFWIFGCLVRVGFGAAAEQVLATGDARIGLLFEGRGLWGRMLLASLLHGLVGIATVLPILIVIGILVLVMGVTDIQGVEGVTIAIAILIGVCYLPVMIYVLLGVSLMNQAVAVEGLGPVEALRRSWDLARGQRLQLFVYNLTLFVFTLLGLFACCVGVLFTGALAEIAQYESYLRLVRSEEEQAKWAVPAA